MATSPMMDVQTVLARVDGAVAGRIGFVRKPGPSDEVLAEFRDPIRTFAVRRPLSPTDSSADDRSTDEIPFVFLPAGASKPKEEIERWITGCESLGGERVVEAASQNDRILWRPRRALLQGEPSRMTEMLTGLAAFAFVEGHLRNVEQEIDADWVTAEADVPLTHEVTRADLGRWRHVNEMTRRVTLRTMRLARLERSAEQALGAPSAPGRRWLDKLCERAEIADRIEAANDRTEALYDLYESANDRLSEFSYFLRECRLEIWIILILGLELAIMGLELWATWRE